MIIDMPKIVTVTPSTPRYSPPPTPTPVAQKLPQEAMLTEPDPELPREHGPFWRATHD